MPPGIFVAATRQHVGKTTSCLALMSGLVRRLGPERVGYIKPVGQQHEIVQGQKIDKDAKLMKEYFGLKCEYKDMSPVVMPKGYTRAFLDGQITEEQQIERIKTCYANIAANADVVVLEGSGHVGVGSIACLNNARVASLLGAELVLVANGGLGSAFDELDLNRAMCKEYGVQLRGVIVNKVMHDKLDMIKEYFAKALKRWDVPLLGVVPDEPFLSRPTIRDIEKLLGGRMLAATEQSRDRHYDMKDILLGMHDVNRFLAALEAATERNPRPLVVTHVSRSDIILAFAAHAKKLERTGKLFEGALILGGLEDETLTPYIQEYVSHYRVPVMHALVPTAAALNKIQAYVSKLNIDDKARVRAAISHYEPHIDFDALRIGQKHH